MKTPIVLVTGATGFVGREVISRLICDGVETRAAIRGCATAAIAGARAFTGLALGHGSDWSRALQDVEVVIHCAGRAHVARNSADDRLAEFRSVNVEGTRALALQAASAGVKRFVFVSSIGVNGNETHDRAFFADDAPLPRSPYARSKMEAELSLDQVSLRTGMERVIVRPPLVYGPNAPGNFGALFQAVCRGVPLPFGAIHNRRSLVALENLVDLLVLCARHPCAAGKTFLVSDNEDISTSTLLRRIAAALGRRPRLLPVPVVLLRLLALAVGKASLVQSLCGSLQVDTAKTRELLGWIPRITLNDGLNRIARKHLERYEKRIVSSS